MIVGWALVRAVARLGRRLVHTGIAVTTLGLLGIAATAHLATHPSPGRWSPPFHRRPRGGHGLRPALRRRAGRRHRLRGRLGLGAAQRAAAALAFSLGIALVATIFFGVLDVPRLPSTALALAALLSIVPLVVSFALAFRLPERARAGAH